MEGFDISTVKSTDKSFPAICSFCGVGELKKLLRIAEIFLLLLLLTWTSTRLPFALRTTADYLRRLLSVVVSHLFIFFLSNAIVLILFFKSRSLFLHHMTFQDHREIISLDFCQDFVAGESLRPAEEVVVYQDKRTILEVTKVRVHKRSQSENFRREIKSELRRSETTEKMPRRSAAEVVDELSNEEFQRAIDAFIAKQIKFHQQEKLAIVLHQNM